MQATTGYVNIGPIGILVFAYLTIGFAFVVLVWNYSNQILRFLAFNQNVFELSHGIPFVGERHCSHKKGSNLRINKGVSGEKKEALSKGL